MKTPKTTGLRPIHLFWILNLALLLLYAWTLTEETTITIQYAGGECAALLPDRTSRIPCPGLDGGYLGLYMLESRPGRPYEVGPLDWLARRSTWREVLVQDGNPEVYRPEPYPTGLAGWLRFASQWQHTAETFTATWPAPEAGEFTLVAALRRPDEDAGIVMLAPDGQRGFAFITTSAERRAGWWLWQDGRPAQLLVGVPFQKSTLAQSQSLMRHLLRAHHGALLLLGLAWLATRLLGKRRLPARLRYPWSLNRFDRPLLAGKGPLLLILLLVFLITTFIAGVVLEKIPHVQDSITYLFQARTMAGGRLWAPASPYPEFFEQEFLLVDGGRWFGKYPPGFPALLALGVLLDQPSLVNPLLAVATIPLLYLLGKAYYGRRAGLIAALLALASPFFLFMSGSMMAHPAELFWTALLMLSWLYALRRANGWPWLALAALALGMLFLTRQVTAVSLGLPFIILAAVAEGRAHPSLFRRSLLMKTGLLLGSLLLFFLLLLLYQWTTTGDPFEDPRLLYWEFDRPGFSQDVGIDSNTFQTVEQGDVITFTWYYDPSQPPRGHTVARGLFNIESDLASLESHLFGWLPFLTLAFCWLALLLKRPGWPELTLLATIGSLALTYTFFWSSGIMYGPRYFYAALPAFLLLTTHGIQLAASRLGNRAGKWVIAGLVGVLIAGNLFFYMPEALEQFSGYNFMSRQAIDQVEGQVQGQALIFVPASEDGNWWEYGKFFLGNTPWLNGRLIYARDLGDQQNRRLQALYPNYQAYRWQDGKLLEMPKFINE